MTDRNLLVLVLDDGFERPLQHALSSREEDARHVRVVAPVQVTPLRWIATDEDEARAEAA